MREEELRKYQEKGFKAVDECVDNVKRELKDCKGIYLTDLEFESIKAMMKEALVGGMIYTCSIWRQR
ncbi:MAG: hypothetical protein DSO07_12215 [Thermoproteota archaeon]|nr:MAG: hypothetical protein DSO07_12215 [Candidatus Korarchaeota archaeon]